MSQKELSKTWTDERLWNFTRLKGKASLYCHFMLECLYLNFNLPTISFSFLDTTITMSHVCQSDSLRHTCVTQLNLSMTDYTQFILVMLQEMLCQMLDRREGGKMLTYHSRGRQWRWTWIFILEKCNLFLIMELRINPMQGCSKLALIAPFPSETETRRARKERASVRGKRRWEIITLTFCYCAQNTLLTDETGNKQKTRGSAARKCLISPAGRSLGFRFYHSTKSSLLFFFPSR